MNWLAAPSGLEEGEKMVGHCGVLASSCPTFVEKHEANVAQISDRLAFALSPFSAVLGHEQLSS